MSEAATPAAELKAGSSRRNLRLRVLCYAMLSLLLLYVGVYVWLARQGRYRSVPLGISDGGIDECGRVSLWFPRGFQPQYDQSHAPRFGAYRIALNRPCWRESLFAPLVSMDRQALHPSTEFLPP